MSQHSKFDAKEEMGTSKILTAVVAVLVLVDVIAETM